MQAESRNPGAWRFSGVSPITQEIALPETHPCDRSRTRVIRRYRDAVRKEGDADFNKQIHKLYRNYLHCNTKQRAILLRNFVWFYPEVSFITRRKLTHAYYRTLTLKSKCISVILPAPSLSY